MLPKTRSIRWPKWGLASVLGLSWVLGMGCGGGIRMEIMRAAQQGRGSTALAHYKTLRKEEGDDEEVLAWVAEALLIEESRVQEKTRREAALRELLGAGARGKEVLRRITQAPNPPLEAFVVLGGASDRDAMRFLRGLADHPDLETRVASVVGMSAQEDLAILLEWCDAFEPELRERACAKLAGAAADPEALRLLSERARIDPMPGVRKACVRALGFFGKPAAGVLLDRLSDGDGSVRQAALEALMRASEDDGREAVRSMLAIPIHHEGLEAAALLVRASSKERASSDEDRASGMRHLLSALQHPDPSIRSHAAVLISGLPDLKPYARALAQRLGEEKEPQVRLGLARAVIRSGEEQMGRAALRRLLREDHGMIGLQAAAMLAGLGEERGIERLREALEANDPSFRLVAAWALAREAMRPIEVWRALEDPEPLVRIRAAGGILAARAARDG
ncbi:MAG: HEAT repeat domain-containing protein [Sandaracinaceae bacterium]|nr:HEAT repeat domain-containing protein [Sandaracinaceae bacterium]